MKKIYWFSTIILSFSLQASVTQNVVGCLEKEESVFKEFLPTGFDKDRSLQGLDQVEIIRQKIDAFIAAHPETKITSISVKTLSARIPFYHLVNNKKQFDPLSDERNAQIAKERAGFVQTLLLGMKSLKRDLKESTLIVESGLAGPEFTPRDLNDRFVTAMTKDYTERVQATYLLHKQIYSQTALIQDSHELLNEEKYPNLYQVKFKPFQGFRLELLGTKKCEDSKEKVPPAIKR